MRWPAKHPGSWRCEFDEIGPAFTDWPILDANGEPVVVTDSGVYPPDPETAHFIVDAVNQINNARGIARTAIGEYAELAAENNRLRKEVGRLRSAVKLLDAAAGPYCAPELRPRLLAEARAALGEGV